MPTSNGQLAGCGFNLTLCDQKCVRALWRHGHFFFHLEATLVENLFLLGEKQVHPPFDDYLFT